MLRDAGIEAGCRTDAPSRRVLGGIFVGGASSRMGTPKGLLPSPDGSGSLLDRLVRVARAVLGPENVVLVGRCPALSEASVPTLDDVTSGAGPLGGLVALLRAAEARRASGVLALGCDLPFVEEALLRRLLEECPDAFALAPRPERFWEPLCARYSTSLLEAAESALQRGDLSLQRLLSGAGATVLPTSPEEQRQLVDWDTPEDVLASRVR